MTHIEQDQQGITISKTLAWTMLVSLLGGGLAAGFTLAELNSKTSATAIAVTELKSSIRTDLDRMEVAIAAERARRDEMAARLNSVERSAAGEVARASAIAAEVKHVREDLRATRQELAEILRILRAQP